MLFTGIDTIDCSNPTNILIPSAQTSMDLIKFIYWEHSGWSVTGRIMCGLPCCTDCWLSIIRSIYFFQSDQLHTIKMINAGVHGSGKAEAFKAAYCQQPLRASVNHEAHLIFGLRVNNGSNFEPLYYLYFSTKPANFLFSTQLTWNRIKWFNCATLLDFPSVFLGPNGSNYHSEMSHSAESTNKKYIHNFKAASFMM